MGELTHIAGQKSYGGRYGSIGFGDSGLAKATEIVATRMKIRLGARPDPATDAANASNYYHNALETICGKK